MSQMHYRSDYGWWASCASCDRRIAPDGLLDRTSAIRARASHDRMVHHRRTFQVRKVGAVGWWCQETTWGNDRDQGAIMSTWRGAMEYIGIIERSGVDAWGTPVDWAHAAAR